MTDQELLDALTPFVSDHKRRLFDRLAPLRTRHVTAVVENSLGPHNASAVVRTCDLVGVQHMHVIEDQGTFRPNDEIALGAGKWVDVHRHGGAHARADCLAALRAAGYRVVATSPRADGHTPATVPIDRPLAFCFGTEQHGLSDALIDAADMHLRIPMYGFTESFNLSVSVAIVLHTVMERMRAEGDAWRCDAAEVVRIKLGWTRAAIRDADRIERRLRDDRRDGGDRA